MNPPPSSKGQRVDVQNILNNKWGKNHIKLIRYVKYTMHIHKTFVCVCVILLQIFWCYASSCINEPSFMSTVCVYMCVCVCVCFINKWHISLCGLFNAKALFVEQHQWYHLTHRNIRDSYLSEKYLTKSECNSVTGVRTYLLQFLQSYTSTTASWRLPLCVCVIWSTT